MEQITLRQLLKDPIFKKWFQHPETRDPKRGSTPPWYVYAQREPGNKWQRAPFYTYRDGLRFVRDHIKDHHDMALSCLRQEYKPPIVTIDGRKQYYLLITPDMVDTVNPDRPTHKWCGYCRRPTVFAYFSYHAALRHFTQSTVRRCTICGVRETFIQRYT